MSAAGRGCQSPSWVGCLALVLWEGRAVSKSEMGGDEAVAVVLLYAVAAFELRFFGFSPWGPTRFTLGSLATTLLQALLALAPPQNPLSIAKGA